MAEVVVAAVVMTTMKMMIAGVQAVEVVAAAVVTMMTNMMTVVVQGVEAGAAVGMMYTMKMMTVVVQVAEVVVAAVVMMMTKMMIAVVQAVEVVAAAAVMTTMKMMIAVAQVAEVVVAAVMMTTMKMMTIKIEPIGKGDPLRKWRKLHHGTSLWWYLQSRNKKSLALNLKSPEAIALIKKMIVDTDILVENMRPGALEKLGLDWETLKSINPKLTFVRISGYGQSGPYKDKPGFGAIGEAMGGIRYTTGSQDSAPARVGVSLGDSLASLHAVIGALMSIVNIKTNNGNGQIVDVSLAESVFNIMESVVPEYDLHGFIRERSGGSLPGIAPSNTYRTKDNAFVVIAGLPLDISCRHNACINHNHKKPCMIRTLIKAFN